MKDKELHNLFRESLSDLQPEFNPNHWAMMQEKLKGVQPSQIQSNKNILNSLTSKRNIISASIVVLISGITYWGLSHISSTNTELSPTQNQSSHTHSSDIQPTFREDETSTLFPEHDEQPITESQNVESTLTNLGSFLAYHPEFVEVSTYQLPQTAPEAKVILMDYGKAHTTVLEGISIQNIAEVELVYTKHPVGFNFDSLNSRRLDKLFELFPELRNNKNLKFRFVAQTACETRSEAESLFHGFVLHYEDEVNNFAYNYDEVTTTDKLTLQELDVPEIEFHDPLTQKLEREIRRYLENSLTWEDSSTYKVLDSYKDEWKNSVVVFDWTSSMFMHGAQATKWIFENSDNDKIKGFVFFNDCDTSGTPVVDSGNEGAMFDVVPTDVNDVFTTMVEAARKGVRNVDYPENDYEAILYALEKYPDVEEVILIADNKSAVRDKTLLEKINKPVRIILCGSTFTKNNIIQPIQDDYQNLAGKSSGSIHVIENDHIDLSTTTEGTIINIDGKFYRFKNGKLRSIRKKY